MDYNEEFSIYYPPDHEPWYVIGERTDMWGVGIILYYMLAKTMPFDSAKPSETRKEYKPLPSYVPD